MRIKVVNIVIATGSLFLHSVATAQSDVLHELQNWFATYHSETVQEKIYVHTDRNFYLAGEMMWLKLYQVDASSNKPIDISKLAYVEILSADYKPVLQSKIEMNEGTGKGSFQIPLSIQS